MNLLDFILGALAGWGIFGMIYFVAWLMRPPLCPRCRAVVPKYALLSRRFRCHNCDLLFDPQNRRRL